MGTTLQNGVYLPNEGERNCYAGLKTNWEILDQKVADVTALQQAVAGALHREIVASLPTTDIDPNTIYMILSGTSATENVYNEFMYVNNAWELIGTSATDLTNYYTKSEVDGKLLLKASASDLTSHTGDTTIHVTASDKAKWDTLALIKHLRLVNAQVGSATTIPFSDFDDTNGIKVGDKCMDLDAKMFEITAVDTTNQTVTVSSALIDLALDANVVHNSGNETISGVKTFLITPYIYNSDVSSSTPNFNLRNSKVTKGTTTDNGLQIIQFLDKDLKYLAQVIGNKLSNGSTALKFNVGTLDSNAQSISTEIQLYIAVNGDKRFIPSNDNDVALGRPLNRWKDVNTYLVNGLEPSSLSLPSGNVSNVIDISSYITALSGGINEYTAPANGWITVTCLGCTGIKFSISNFMANGSYRENPNQISSMIPICKNQKVGIYIYGSSPTIQAARFIPCQGNI